MKLIKSVEVSEFRFFKMPKFIFESEKYASLKSEDIVLYSVILDGISLSASNGNNFREEDGSLYTTLTIDRAMGYTRMSEKSVRNSFKRLKEAGLIHVKRMGLQKPNRIFVYDIESPNGSSYHSGLVTVTALEKSQLPPNDTDLNNTDLNDLKDTATPEQSTETKQSPPQEKPKRYTVLTNGGYICKAYATAYRKAKRKEHPKVDENELSDIDDALMHIVENLDIDVLEIEDIFMHHFTNLTNKNNGHIAYLVKSKGNGPLQRIVESYELNSR